MDVKTLKLKLRVCISTRYELFYLLFHIMYCIVFLYPLTEHFSRDTCTPTYLYDYLIS